MIVDPGLDEAYFLAADEVRFEQELELGATIYVEEDYSLEAAPRELRDEYEAAQLSGDKDRVEAILTELWEEYGIDPKKDPDQRATGGIRKLVVTDDHLRAWLEFEHKKAEVTAWLERHGCTRPHRTIQFF